MASLFHRRAIAGIEAGRAGCLAHGRAQVNEELAETLHDYEQEESVRFDRMERDWENRFKDPDDVFLSAQDRRQEIKKTN